MPCPCCNDPNGGGNGGGGGGNGGGGGSGDWVFIDCACPGGSPPPSSVTLTLSNLRFCDQDDVGGENSNGRFFAPPDIYRFADIEGTRTLQQDVFGPFKRFSPINGQLIEGAIARNCVNYTYFQGDSVKMTVGRWPPTAGTFYWLFFSGGDMSAEGVFLGGGNYDICTGVGTQPDLMAAFALRRNGSAIKVTGAGREWPVYACVNVSITR